MHEIDKVLDTSSGYSVKVWRIIGQCYSNIGLFSNAAGGSEKLDVEEVVATCPKCKCHMLEHAVEEIPTKNDPEILDIKILENVVIGEHMEYRVLERWHLNIATYTYTFENERATIHRGPSRRVYLENTYRCEREDLDISDE
jgi:hypothetical protein